MRLASFERRGRPGFGIVVGDGVVDLAARFAGKANTLREVLASVGSRVRPSVANERGLRTG